MSTNIKKSLLITLDFPPNMGGVAAYYYNVCKNLPADKIVVLAPEQKGDENFDIKQQFPIVRKKLLNLLPKKNLHGLAKISSSLKWISAIRYFSQIAKNHKIELIQAGQVLPIGTLAMIYKQRKKIPYIFYAHGLDITLPQKFRRKKSLLKKIIKSAKGIVANSYFTKDELIKLGAKDEQIIVVHPCPNFKADRVSEEKIDDFLKKHNLENKKILLTVGRLIERKGHDLAIKAMPEIIKQVTDAAYLIAGSGPYEDRLKQLAKQSGLNEEVKFLGALTNDELKICYEICDAFIMPARQLANGDVEGFGIVYLEANSFGKPVIGGRSGGVPEAVIHEKTGLLVNPTDVDEIADAAIKLLTDPAYAHKLGMQGQERVEEEFNWREQTEKIEQLLM